MNLKKNQIITLAFYLSLILFLTALWWYEGIVTHTVAGRSIIAQGLRYFGDAALIITPFIFLKRNCRWVVFIPVYIVCLWVIGSVWYFRFWADLPGVSSIFLVSNVGTELFRSALALWSFADIVFMLLLVALTVIYSRVISNYVKSASFAISAKLALLLFGILAFLGSQFISTYVNYKYYNAVNMKMSLWETTVYRTTTPIIHNAYDLGKVGPVIHVIKSTNDAVQVAFLKKDLSDKDKESIENFISSTPSFPAIPDSVISANQDKNIILIIVESLNAQAIYETVNNKPVAPTLKSLIDAEGSISALNIVTQVRAGGSGDGQMITNTGLYPLPTFSVPIALGSSNAFPALPFILGRKENIAVFSDECKSWNERNTFTSYGFDPIYSRLDYPELIAERGCDGGLFNFASKLIPTLKQPFFLELLTVSMHTPFDDSEIPSALHPNFTPEKAHQLTVELDYLEMLNYFDSQLGLFIQHLKEKDIFDNTMLIIVSDHSQEIVSEYSGGSQSSTPMTMIIANSGISAKINSTVGQVDIFPTILNLLNVSGPKGWRGAGVSILTPGLNAAATPFGVTDGCDSVFAKRLMDAQAVSELIHRTNYFAR